MRKFAIILIAILFLLLGSLSIIRSVNSVTSAFEGEGQINFYVSIAMPFMFYAGFNLYQLRESGRKVALTLFTIQVVANTGFLVWALFQKGESFQFWINFLGNDLVIAENRLTFAIVMVVFSLVLGMMMLFLILPKTKELFSVQKELTTQVVS